MTDADLDTDDYDNPWKDVLEGHFEDAMRRFFPAAHHRIDRGAGCTFGALRGARPRMLGSALREQGDIFGYRHALAP